MFDAAHGVDSIPAVDKGPPKSITVEDSQKTCASTERMVEVLKSLVPDLMARVREDHLENARWPKTFKIQWRDRSKSSARSASSCVFPSYTSGFLVEDMV